MLVSEPAAAVLGVAAVQAYLGVVAAAAAALALLPGVPQAAAGEAWHLEASGHRARVEVVQASALLHRWGPWVAILAARGPGPCLAGVAGAAGWAQGRSGRAQPACSLSLEPLGPLGLLLRQSGVSLACCCPPIHLWHCMQQIEPGAASCCRVCV